MLRHYHIPSLTSSSRRALSSSAPLTGKPTALRSRHLKLNADLVDFAGYQLPVLFKGKGVMDEHLHTRSAASVFDVSHMGQIKIYGDDRIQFMEKLVVGNVKKLKPGQSLLSVMCREDTGGIIDDCIVSNAGDHLHLVVNGACKVGDLAHMKQYAPNGIKMEVLPSNTTVLVALQGPKAAHALKTLMDPSVDLKSMDFMTCKEEVTIAGVKCRLSRCGYTGEDGFEISAVNDGGKVYDALLSCQDVSPAGLGARDSLRLEAGLCLYGHDLNEKILPIEAGLAWLIPKERRTDDATFLGASKVLQQLKDTPAQKRVGFVIPMGPPAREGARIFDKVDAPLGEIGQITSGCYSPTLKKPIAMGYIATQHSKLNTEVFVEVRGKKHKAIVSKMPFVSTNYYRVGGA